MSFFAEGADVLEPLVRELSPAPDPEEAFLRVVGQPHCLFLDSARRDPQLGRYSFLAADPYEILLSTADDDDALAPLAHLLETTVAPSVAGLPPFQGGAAGLLSYDLGRQLERLPRPRWDEFQLPRLCMGLYDVVVAWDHATGQAWVISHGFPEQELGRRCRRAVARLEWMTSLLSGKLTTAPVPQRATRMSPVTAGELAPQFAVSGMPGLTSNFSRETYLQTVQRAIDYVLAGDIFQVNLAQRLLTPAREDALPLYLRLRKRNQAPFAGYFDLGDFQLCSASPERFVQVHQREVEARPIKGTRLRSQLPEADLYAADELRESDKDRAENVMIVDLLRNDLSRVCQPESVRVPALCRLETYQYVQHLVSEIRGTLAAERTNVDLLRAAFPGGSITGAPKIRAMEIIAELEQVARGAYCGSLGYIGFDGSMDLNILIRTITAGRGWWQAPVGGGIVVNSVPSREYEETWHKAEGMLRAFHE